MSTFQWVCFWAINIPLFLVIGRLFFFKSFGEMKDSVLEALYLSGLRTDKESRQHSEMLVIFWLGIWGFLMSLEIHLIIKYLGSQ